MIDKNPKDIQFILNSQNLEKKSNIRKFFEKEKLIICVPFYEDNSQTLNSIISQFFRNRKIPISQQLINILIERSRGDRKNLNNELLKIESFLLKMSDLVIESQTIFFSTNKDEFFSISADSGIINWKQKINSDIRPIISDNLIFTVSLEGFLFVIDKQSGNIIRITDVFDGFKKKKKRQNKTNRICFRFERYIFNN